MSSLVSTWLDNACFDAVEYFWRRAGEVEPFPRSLERPLALALPVALVKLPQLRLRDIEHWLRARSVPFSFGCESRAMRGCLVAFAGSGVIFIDGADSADEQRVSVAHETAHFLIDYLMPRQKAVERYGAQIAEAFDGRRPPSLSERLYGLMDGMTIGAQTDLMQRTASNDFEQTWRIESRADRMAMALLAPPDVVLRGINLAEPEYARRLDSVVGALRTSYALPAGVATSYAAELLLTVGKGPSWAESIRHAIRPHSVELPQDSAEH